MRRRFAVVLLLALSCTVTGVSVAPSATGASHNPVLIVPGFSSPGFATDLLAARLSGSGFTTFNWQLPGLGFGDIRNSANALATKVQQVRAATGAAKVDLVAHSEGGLVARYYLKFLGGTAYVGRYVSLGTPQYGTALANLATLVNCVGLVACQQMTIGSSFLSTLNAGDDTPGSVAYTSLYTWNDEIVVPPTTAIIDGGATNASIQQFCWLRVVGHLGLILDGTVYSLVQSALNGGPLSANCWAV